MFKAGNLLSTPPCRLAAIAVLTCASAAALSAQRSTAADGIAPIPTTSQLVIAPLNLDLADAAGVSYSSSAAPLAGASDETASLTFAGLPADAALQPPPRRRYGRPRYNDSSHNSDGSNKYTFVAGVGFTQPLGNTYHYLTPSYGYQVGGGRNFNKKFATLLQFDWDNFGFTGQTIYNQSSLYNTLSGGAIPQIDGNSHVWSFTLNPTYQIYTGAGLGAYVVAGVGFYHKVATFFVPEVVSDGFYEYEENATVDHYSSNAPGFNGGFGITYKASRFANERFYAEVRYVFVDNSQRFGLTVANLNTPAGLAYTGYNVYPANSNRTTYIPIKFGIRF